MLGGVFRKFSIKMSGYSIINHTISFTQGLFNMFIESLEHRYATKKFDEKRKISQEQLDRILEAGRLSPSSYGLQPYRFVVIEDYKTRQEISPACYQQPQINAASHLILLQVRKTIDIAFINTYIELIATERSMPIASLTEFKNMIIGSTIGHPQAEVFSWSSKQAYIALGFMIFAAALEKIDACPMEGFHAVNLDELLKTDADYQTVALLTLGYRDSQDPFADFKKVRWSREHLVVNYPSPKEDELPIKQQQ
ncbi:NAD(P)H-dependent oxidoreductase [bacterium]|nr:NAD(P)H-dependent oxidoreductase [bacterium]NBX72421.1 NAD(P)H-dependent oxidoreductase [bacterium]